MALSLSLSLSATPPHHISHRLSDLLQPCSALSTSINKTSEHSLNTKQKACLQKDKMINSTKPQHPTQPPPSPPSAFPEMTHRWWAWQCWSPFYHSGAPEAGDGCLCLQRKNRTQSHKWSATWRTILTPWDVTACQYKSWCFNLFRKNK